MHNNVGLEDVDKSIASCRVHFLGTFLALFPAEPFHALRVLEGRFLLELGHDYVEYREDYESTKLRNQ